MRFTPRPTADALDADTVRRLLEGMAPDDAPPGYSRVAALLRAAEGPPVPGELEVSGDFAARLAAGARQRRRAAAGAHLEAQVVAGSGRRHDGRRRSHCRGDRGGRAAGTCAASRCRHAGANRRRRTRGHEHWAGRARVGRRLDLGPRLLDGPRPSTTLPSPSADAADPGTDHESGSETSNLATTTDETGVDKGAAISGAASDGQSHAGEPPGQNKPPNDAPPSTRPEPPGHADEHSSSGTQPAQSGGKSGNHP